MSQETPKNTYVTLHKNFVRTDIEYTDRRTGETRTFNSVTLPKGTVIDGHDVSYYQFSPLFVNESRYRGEDYRDIPLLTEREVWLRRSILDEDGKPVVNDEGVEVKDVIKVMPAQIRDAIEQNRTEYLESLADRAATTSLTRDTPQRTCMPTEKSRTAPTRLPPLRPRARTAKAA